MPKLDCTALYAPSDPQFQSNVKDLLHGTNAENVRITFTKADGTKRTMRCTLEPALVPAEKAPAGKGREYPATTQRVFDLDKGEWRSFKWDTVTQVEYDTGITGTEV